MGSESGNRNGGGGHVAAVEKLVRRVKEVVDCTEEEIYAVLKECDMDVNRAVEKLLSQDTFHEVKSKRERRKEGAFNSRTRGNNAGLSGGGKTGTGSDWTVIQNGLTHLTHNEHAKATDKGGGSVCPSVMSVVRKSTKSDYFSTDNGRQPLRTGDSITDSAHASPGPQPSMRVGQGCLSMADIVRIGQTQTSSQDVVSHNHCNTSVVSVGGNSESSLGLRCQNYSEQHVFHDESPIIEQPVARNSQALNMSDSSNANGSLEHPSLHVTAMCLNRNCELDADQVLRADIASDSAVSENKESASVSSKHAILISNTGLGSHSNSNLRNTLSSDHEDVLSAASINQQLSIGESKQKVPAFEDDPAVVIPTHLQALGADCSRLSFGTYNGGSSSASSVILTSDLSKSGMEEKSQAVDDSSALLLDASSAYCDDKQLGFDVLRRAARDKKSNFLSSPKHMALEETLEHGHNMMACLSDPSLQESHWMNTSLPSKHPGLQSGNHFISPRELYADSNSIPGDVLAFLMSQSQPTRYSNSNAVSSISSPSISMSKVMGPGAFALSKGSAHPQDPTVQSSTCFQQFPDTNGYLSLPQNEPYISTINSQQVFSGNIAYNQSSVYRNYNLPQNKNKFLTSRLPPATARDAFGYGNLGSSFYSPGSSLSNLSLGCMMPSSNLNENLSSQYNDGHNISSIQQGGSFSNWDYGDESRSSFIPDRTQYKFRGQPNQASLSQYVSPGYSDLHHSQTRLLEERQQPADFQDLSSKQLHQFWQYSH